MSDRRRSAHRHQLELPARLTVGDHTHDVVIDNLSLGGAQMALGQRLTMGQRVRILFHIPAHDRPIEVQATVRWSNDQTVGVQFEGLQAREVWAMNKFFASLE